MKESLVNSGLDEQSPKDKAYSNILGTGKYLYGASLVDETTKERSSTILLFVETSSVLIVCDLFNSHALLYTKVS
jgi:hypothetical protein